MGTELHLQMASIDRMVDSDSAESVQEADLILSQAEAQLKEHREKLIPLSIAQTRKNMEAAGWIYLGGGCFTPGPTVPPVDWSSPPSPEFLAKLQRAAPEIFEELYGEKTQK